MTFTKTKKNNKTNKTKTRKNKITPKIKNLNIGFSLFASKKFKGDEILEYNQKMETKTHDSCLQENSSWFGNLTGAKWYNTKGTHIYKWKIQKPCRLFFVCSTNADFLKHLFLNTDIKLTPSIVLPFKKLKKVKYNHPYLNMTHNERAYFEFCFAFGYITVKEQYEFLELLKYLINNGFIEMKRREGTSIINVLNVKIGFYLIKHLVAKNDKFNRLSFYLIDKYAIMNFCRLTNNTKYQIDGVYQRNDISFWFSQVITKRDIEEYILFNPHHNLVYKSMM